MPITDNRLTARLMHAVKAAADWAGYQVVPLKGELCFESDTLKFKLGDGAHIYDDLPYCVNGAGFTHVSHGEVDQYAATESGGRLRLIEGEGISIEMLQGQNLGNDQGADDGGWYIKISGPTHGDIVAHDWSEVTAAVNAAVAALDATADAGAGKVLQSVTQADGRIAAGTAIPYATIAPVQGVQGSAKISVTGTTTKTISHAGGAPTRETAAFSGALSAVVGVESDATGHVTKVTTAPLGSVATMAAGGTVGHILLSAGGRGAVDGGRGVTETITTAGGGIPTEGAVRAYVSNRLGDLSGAMRLKGTLGAGGTVASLPAAPQVGDAYVVASAGTYGGTPCEVGDYVVCVAAASGSDPAKWSAIEKTVAATNLVPALKMDGGTYDVGTVEGVTMQVMTPSLDMAQVGGAGKMITTVSQSDGLVSAVAVDAPANTDFTALAVGGTLVRAASATGVSLSAGQGLDIAAAASGDAVTVSHKGSAAGASGAAEVCKLAWDAMGHITAKAALTAADMALSTAPANTASAANDSKMTLTMLGVTKTLTQPINTDMLKAGNLTLVIDGTY